MLVSAALLAAACGAPAPNAQASPGGSAARAPAFETTATWGPASWTYNKFGTGYFGGFGVQLPLGIPEKTKNRIEMFNIIPQLYRSFSEGTNTITVHLIPGERFSDGEPLNAQDVVDTILLSGVQQSYTFDVDVTGASAPNPTTVVIDFLPNVPSIIKRGWMLGVTPLPMSQYGQFLPAGMEQDVWAYNKLLQNTSTAPTAQSSAAYKAIEADFTKLEHYQPKKLIGDGPFMLTGASTGSAVEVRSPTYFDAARVHVQKLTLLNTATSSANVYPLLYSGDVDWYGPATPSAPEYEQWQGTAGAHSESVNGDVTQDIVFNNQRYPFTLQKVRQAMAYLIDRRSLLESEDGGRLIGNRPDQVPDGLGGLLNSIWLSPAQLAQLNRYQYSPSRATGLLESAGFHKSGGHWIMPNGQPFATTVISSASSPPPSGPLFAKQVASVLTNFGIQATANAVNASGYAAQISKGQFDIAQETGVGTNLAPLCGLASSGLGAPINYSFSSNGAFTSGEPGIGFGPTRDIPGIGTVQVSQTADYECQHIGAGPRAAALSWDWARVVNSQVPFLTYGDDYSLIMYSGSHYSWPAPSNSLWQEAGIYTTQTLMIMIERGLVSPR